MRTPKITPRLPATSAAPRKTVKPFAHSDILASRLRILEVIPSAGNEHKSNHDAQKKKRDISELGQLWKDHAVMSSISAGFVASTAANGQAFGLLLS